MHHIRKWYNVISMDELAAELGRGKGFCSPSVAVTIDDGYVNNYTFAFPILKQLDLPATIYLTTGCIGTNKGLWVDDLEDMLMCTRAESICVSGLAEGRSLDISSCRGKEEALLKLFEMLVKLDHSKKVLYMQELCRAMRVEEVYKHGDARKMLNWREVVEMNSEGICFGAHTVSHSTLSKMEFSEAKREIFESKIEIEARIGSKVRHFAIPNGRVEDFNEELKKYCKEIGMSSVVSTEPGSVSLQSDPYFLKRINPPAPIYMFACEMARYMFFKKME